MSSTKTRARRTTPHTRPPHPDHDAGPVRAMFDAEAGPNADEVPPDAGARDLRGHVDSFAGMGVHGWAVDLSRPASPVWIEVWEGDSLLAAGETTLPRDDVTAAGYNGVHAGFSIALPEALRDGAVHNLMIRPAGSEVVLGEIAQFVAPAEIGMRDYNVTSLREDIALRSSSEKTTDSSVFRDIDAIKGLPIGFDPDLYLQLNADVADIGADPVLHYLEWGRAELRSLLPPGQPLNHPHSRMLSATERDDWHEALRRRVRAGVPLLEVLESHPRASWLYTGFSLSSWLQQNQDIAEDLEDPLEGAFHYLEFGLEEGRRDRPETWNADFVAARYGLNLDPEKTTPIQALAAVLALGISPLEVALEEAHQWELAGLRGAILSNLFDHEYYHAMVTGSNLAAGSLPGSLARADCIAHFLDYGIDRLLPIHPDHIFDAPFYAGQLPVELRERLRDPGSAPAPAAEKGGPEARSTSRAEIAASRLYRDWLSHGLRHGRSANPLSWAKHHFGINLPNALFDQLGAYRLAANLNPGDGRLAVLQHFLSTPRPAAVALDLRAAGMVDLITDMAHRALDGGRTDEAEWLGWLALAAVVGPDGDRVRLLLADLAQRKGQWEQARWLRSGVPNGWALVTQAETLLNCQQYEAAFAQLIAISERFPGDMAIMRRNRDLARHGFYRIWNNIGPHVAAHGIAATQRQLRAALRACTPAYSSADRTREIHRVAIIGNEDLYQCKLYRVDQKAEQLREAGYQVTVLSPSRELDQFVAKMDDYDAVIFFRVPAFPPMIDAIVSAVRLGLLTFYEVDDLIFDAEHFPPALDTYAGQIDAAQHAAMACGVPLFEHAMRLCDYGIASTATIARLMETRVRTGRVFEHHNALGLLHMAAVRMNSLYDSSTARHPDTPLMLFYASGTKAHKEDFHDILEPALAEILRRHPGRVQIRLIGHFGAFTHLDPKVDPVDIREPVWDFEAFCSMVSKADINLAILKPTLLTDAKSEIKWMEAAMFGIPSVVSATATHCEVIKDGQTGFLARTTADFVVALDRLIGNPKLRARVGNAARKRVMAGYTIAQMGSSLRNMFETLRPPGRQRKRLMVVNVYYPPQTIGGATRVVVDNVAALRAHYGELYEIDVVTTLEGGLTSLETLCHTVDGIRVWTITAPPQADGDMTARDPRMAGVFERLVARLQPDLIHFHCIQRLTAAVVDVARYHNIPYMITLHDGWWISPNQFIINDHDEPEYYDYRRQDDPDFPARAQMLARPLRGAARLLAVSESFAELHRACGLDNVVTVENGVSPLTPCPRSVSPAGRVRLAHIGGISRHKGYHLIRNAVLANAYSNLELLIVDHGMPPGTRRETKWGTTPVTFIGKVPQSTVAQLYRDIDVLLAPSIWPESYGLVTREAMACGNWVIASDRGAIGADVEEGVNGHRISVDSYTGLAEVLWRVDRNPGRYLGPPESRRQPRTVLAQVEALDQLYRDLLSEVVSKSTTRTNYQ